MFSSKKIDIKNIGESTIVPNDVISKLQYYIKIIFGIIEMPQDNGFDRIMNYNSNIIKPEDFKNLLIQCLIFSPELFLNKCIFIQPILCGNSQNRILEISEATNILAIGNGVLIGGIRQNIKKILVCRK